MNNHTSPFLLLGFFLVFNNFVFSQTPNQARIFHLTDLNASPLATEIINYMNTFPFINNIPSHSALQHFLSTPLATSMMHYDTTICSRPLVRAYNSTSTGGISFRFGNKDPLPEKALLVGALNYSGSNPVFSFVHYGEELFDGFDFPAGFLQYHILLLGTVCNDCPTNPGGQCISKMEILIVDKNIL